MKPDSVSTKQKRIAELARSNRGMAFTSLNHYIDYEWMQYAYECTRKDGAVGVDGQTAQDYASNLEQNLRNLIDRLKSGRYQAPPVRRHYIAKADGGQRGLGIPSFEDKVAQRAVAMLLEPIYEQAFFDSSYGFRPGRSALQALQAVRAGVMERRGKWVLDVDVRKYFDSIDRTRLREFLANRVTDGVVRRLIDKWLKAGVLEDGQVFYPDKGTPPGRGNFTMPGKYFPPPCAGRMVQHTGGCATEGREYVGAVLRRLCDDFRIQGRRAAGVCRVGKAVREVRPAVAPGQDTVDRFPIPDAESPTTDVREDLRLFGLYACQGDVQDWQTCNASEDG
ncbi:hypothetical protein J8I87_42925 [Paraburkholderia sp. LEh10]|nr:reverse transcriptase domain-containing protein [Paraburkholderia sp. LEh10]MBP0596235.1 hypothetical protein [Paraburkholderia sp. LEh10]